MDSTAFNPISVAHPGEIVLDYLDSFEWSQRDLARRTGITTKTISEICSGKASISTTTSIAFERVFGRPAHFWQNLQSRFDECEARKVEAKKSSEWKSWLKNFPLAAIRRRGWIPKTTPEAEIFEFLKFLGVSSPDGWDAVWKAANASYRQTRRFEISDYAVSAWVRRIELLSEELDVDQFNEEKLEDSLEEIRGYTRLPIGEALEKTQLCLKKSGVAFVVEPALPKTEISGCTRWVNSRKAIIALSLRYRTDDQIWFTLFHEIAHVLLHRKQHSFILDNADQNLTDGIVDPEMQKFEDEANRFAADTLIPSSLLNKFISYNIFTDDIIHEFAEAIRVSPGIVVGRLQREGLLTQWQGNQLKQRVNWTYMNEENAT